MLPGPVIPLQHYLLGQVRRVEICPRVERVSCVHVERIRRAVEVMLMNRLRRTCLATIPAVAAVAVRRDPPADGLVYNDIAIRIIRLRRLKHTKTDAEPA